MNLLRLANSHTTLI